MAIARPESPQSDDVTTEYLVTLLERILQDPPQDWHEDRKVSLSYAIHNRYSNSRGIVPEEIHAVLQLIELTNGSQNPLVKLVQRAGLRGTESVEACKEMLASAETRDISYQQVASVLIYLTLVTGHNAKNFVAALREHRTGQRLDWQDVVHAFDRESLRVSKPQFLALLISSCCGAVYGKMR
jgi:CCR4-NOT transcription complex subunit 1